MSTETAAAPAPVHHCGHCGIVAKLVCTRCRAVRYCSATCQKEAWPAHAKLCKAVPSYVAPPDSERCKTCRGWGKDLLRPECEGHCASCFRAATAGSEAAAGAGSGAGAGAGEGAGAGAGAGAGEGGNAPPF